MNWYLESLYPVASAKIDTFPFYVGRGPENQENCLILLNQTISRNQFVLESRLRGVFYKNLSKTSPAELDGVIVVGERKLESNITHVIHMGDVSVVIGTNASAVKQMAMQLASERYLVNHN